MNPMENLPPFWNLMPTTPDTQLKRVAKSNLTVAKIVDGKSRDVKSLLINHEKCNHDSVINYQKNLKLKKINKPNY